MMGYFSKRISIFSSWTSSKKISVLYKYFFSYFIIILIPFLLLGIFLFGHAVDKLNAEVQSSYSYKLDQVSKDIDDQFNKFEAIALNIANNNMLKPYKLNDNAYNEIEAVNELKKYKEKSMLADECIYYIRGTDDFYTSSGKYNSSIYLDYKLDYNDWNSFIEDINSCRKPFVKYSENAIFDGNETIGLLTYAYPVSLINTSSKNAVVIFIITPQSIKNKIKNLIGELNGALYAFSREGGPILTINYSDDISKQWIDNNLLNIKSTTNEVKYDAKKFMIFRTTSAKMECDYLLVLPWMKLMEQATQLKNIMFYIMLAAFLTSITVGIIFSYINFKPIKRLDKILKDKGTQFINVKNRNEIDNISLVLENTIESNDLLKSRVDEQNRQLKIQILTSILKGSFDERMTDQFQDINLKLDRPFYFVIVVSIIKSAEKGTYVYKDDIIKIIESEYSIIGATYCIEHVNPNLIAVICNMEDNLQHNRFLLATEMREKCCKCGISVRLGVGSIYDNLKKIESSFIEAYSAIEFHKDEAIIYFEDVKSEYSLFNWYPTQEIFRLQNSIKLGDVQHAMESADNISSIIKGSSIPEVVGKYVYFDIVNSLLKIVKEINAEVKTDEISRLLLTKNVNELFPSLCRIIQDICGKVNENMQRKDSLLVNNIITYIDENYLEYDLVLEKLAQKFNHSIYYLSKLFKENMSIGFKEYVIKKRIEEARRLLNETQLSINEISESIGYSNVSHFIKTFKTIEGVTPVQFRDIGSN